MTRIEEIRGEWERSRDAYDELDCSRHIPYLLDTVDRLTKALEKIKTCCYARSDATYLDISIIVDHALTPKEPDHA